MATKVCSKCKVEKDVGEFHRDKTTKDGLRRRCKACVRVYDKAWREENKERQQEYSQKRLTRTTPRTESEKVCTRCIVQKRASEFGTNVRARDGLNTRCKDCIREVSRRRYYENADASRAASRAAYERDKEAHYRRTSAYKKARRERFREIDKAWREANPDKVKAFESRKSRKKIDDLADRYVKDKLRKLGVPTPSPELIEMKREQLMLYRLTKQLFETIKEVSGNESDRVDESPVGDGPEE